ncbi:MAG: hypothetical protein ABSC06_34775 [Rhodopila sp.]
MVPAFEPLSASAEANTCQRGTLAVSKKIARLLPAAPLIVRAGDVAVLLPMTSPGAVTVPVKVGLAIGASSASAASAREVSVLNALVVA